MKKAAALLLSTIFSSEIPAAVYTFAGGTSASSPGYGISGTITTNDAVGFGTFNDPTIPIVSWVLSLQTPTAADGIEFHELTELNSTLGFSFAFGSVLEVTPTQLLLGPTATPTDFDTMNFTSNAATAERVEILSPTIIVGPTVQIRDPSENPSLGAITPTTVGSIPFNLSLLLGTAVPEPSSSALLIIGALGFLSRRRRH